MTALRENLILIPEVDASEDVDPDVEIAEQMERVVRPQHRSARQILEDRRERELDDD